MKKLKLALTASIILTGCLILFLPGINPLESPPESINGYGGFMKPVEGEWVVYSIPGGLEEKMYYVGEEKIGGVTARGLEVQLKNSSGHMGTFQLWVDSGTGELVKYAARIRGNVLCMDSKKAEKQFQNIPSLDKTPEKYYPRNAKQFSNISLANGQMVPAAKFMVDNTEVWVSSNVSFGIISAKNKDGETLMRLLDYNLYGAQRTISRKELDECVAI